MMDDARIVYELSGGEESGESFEEFCVRHRRILERNKKNKVNE
jgi:hypothetical protein